MADQNKDKGNTSGDKRNDSPNTGGRVDRNSGDQNQGSKGGNQR